MRHVTVLLLAVMVFMSAQSVRAEILINGVLGRSLVFQTWGDSQDWLIPPTVDPEFPENDTPGLLLKNGYRMRTDRFTNTSAGFILQIDDIEIFACNPEDIGINDIYGSYPVDGNFGDVLTAVTNDFPDYSYWGGGWWVDQTDDPPVTWDPPIIAGGSDPFPVTLMPGQAFDLDSEYLHFQEVWDFFEDPSFRAGELIVGFRVTGTLIPVPEPSSLLLATLGLLGAIGMVRIQRRRRASVPGS